VQAFDKYNDAVPSAPVTLSVNNGGTITGGSADTGSDGSAADFSDVTISPAGTYTLTASSNGVNLGSSQITISAQGTALKITTKPTLATYGKAITVSGTLTSAGQPLAGRTVLLYYRKLGSTGAYTHFPTTATSNASGVVTFTTFKPTTPVQISLAFAGTNIYGNSSSAVQKIDEQLALTISAPGTGTKGKKVKFTGAASPNKHGVTVYLQRQSGSSWTTVGSKKLTSASKYSIALKLASKGKFTYRVLVKAVGGFSQSVSSTKSLKVK